MLFFDELFHEGTPQRFDGDPKGSGRYRKGSGENPHQHGSGSYYDRIMELHDLGMSYGQIAKEMGMTTTQVAHELNISSGQLRAKISIEKEQREAEERRRCLELQEQGYNKTQIAQITGIKASTVANRLKPIEDSPKSSNRETADILKEFIADGRPYLDVGDGVDLQLGISKEKLRTALAICEEEGYKVTTFNVPQATNPNQKTEIKVLTKDDVSFTEIYQNRDQIISPLGKYSDDGGHTWSGIQTPINIDHKRIDICYAEQGGRDKDGLIELRPGIRELSLGENSYAQVRISVDGTHYLKGMAIYNKDLPPGVDIRFNTNKHLGTPMLGDKDNSVLKPLKSDPDNPFGSTIRQLKDSNDKVYSACNLVNEPADWDKWSKNLSSQFLSKQEPMLAKQQLDLAYQSKKAEFDLLCKYTNPTIKKKLLLSFADECDSDAVELKGAALPRQKTHVILPLTTLKDNEVYAPNYETGEQVALIRYPHQGRFEIPIVTVNNNNQEGKRLLGNPKNAIGINAKVAERLSGADFDGDTVVVIPTKGQNIKNMPQLKELEGFDPKERYRAYPGMPEVGPKTGFNKQLEMGKISNLVTDMTIQGASMDKIARATKHAQVVIDAEKHNLDWRRSYEENQIAALKKEFQGGENKGASTIISRASSDAYVPKRKVFNPSQDIDKETGKKTYRETGETKYQYSFKNTERAYKNKDGNFYIKDPVTGKNVTVSAKKVKEKTNKETGETYFEFAERKTRGVFKNKDGEFYYKDRSTGEKIKVPSEKVKVSAKTEKSNKMTVAFEEGKDAFSLVGVQGSRIEKYYAEYANKMKALGNEARKEYLATPTPKVNKSAKQTYAAEVKSLDSKLEDALRNAPRERQAQLLANSQIQKVIRHNPEIANDQDQLKKKRAQVIEEARVRTGSIKRKSRNIEITDREWEAIQANAVSHTKLEKILRNTDEQKIKERAMPRDNRSVSSASLSRARAMMNMGYTQEEAAKAIGVSVSTLNRAL